MQMPDKYEEKSRLGFHYFPDTLHYGVQDAQSWADGLMKLGANWILLHAPQERAIPETFLTPLIEAGINPVLQFHLPAETMKSGDGFQVLFNHYARLGVKYVIFFDRPNLQKYWPASIWAQDDLVERFLDQFLPLGELALYEGLKPVFPRLEPGGDYWDLAFLQAAFKNMQRRGKDYLLNEMALAVSGQAGNRPLDWGAGGVDRWPGLRPYQSHSGMQDQQGFRTFDWYLDICLQVMGKSLPVFLLDAGSKFGDRQDKNYDAVDQRDQVQRNLSIIRWLHGETENTNISGNSPGEILACFFDLHEFESSSLVTNLFHGKQPFANEVRRWAASYRGDLLPPIDKENQNQAITRMKEEENRPGEPGKIIPEVVPVVDENSGVLAFAAAPSFGGNGVKKQAKPKDFHPDKEAVSIEGDGGSDTESSPISHYVLLPLYAWGAAEWDLELITPLLQEGHPTVGFSLTEAGMADRVTVVGGKEVFSDQVLETLSRAGCIVERILSDGTLVATY